MSDESQDHRARLTAFLVEYVLPAEASLQAHHRDQGPHHHSVAPIVEELKSLAKQKGLWNLFLPSESGLTNLDYAPLAEISGWSMELAPEALNSAVPDAGIMEMLQLFATAEQRVRWLVPLLNGEIRSAFALTEPAVASSDADNIETRATRDGDGYIVNGRKWWVTGAADPRCKILVVMCRTGQDGIGDRRHSLLLVPPDTPGITIERSVQVFGWQDPRGHCEISFDNVWVPVTNLLHEEGCGLAVTQARLGRGRLHHCLRAVGVAERALTLMVERARARVVFGAPLADQSVVQQQIARSRIEIDQARLLCLETAWTLDHFGDNSVEAGRTIAEMKAVAPQMACNVIDRAIQLHGAAGLCDDTPLARMYGWHRAMRLFNGPDEVHIQAIARMELARPRTALASGALAVGRRDPRKDDIGQ